MEGLLWPIHVILFIEIIVVLLFFAVVLNGKKLVPGKAIG